MKRGCGLTAVSPVVLVLVSSLALTSASAQAETASPQGRELFVDVAEEVGIDFVHVNGGTGEFYMAEINGAGCGLVDFDSDGDLDVYLVQGGPLGGSGASSPSSPPPGDRLYRNDRAGDSRGGHRSLFLDITAAAAIRAPGYGFGVASGDYDNDGEIDLYITNFGPNQLLRNNGDGTFSDVTLSAGTDDERWSVPAAFVDYDRDGWLDIYIGNYVDFTLQNHKVCRASSGARDYCGPNAYVGVPDRLLHNRGDGTFEDVSHGAGMRGVLSKTLGLVTGDFNDDGWLDIYVANDGVENQMWMNRGNGTFEDEALFRGSAVNLQGMAEGSMGVDAADFDADGDEDLFMTHLITETNTVFLNDGSGMFEDASIQTRLGAPSLSYTSWGTRWFDFDNDGWLDLFVANGAVRTIEKLAKRGDPFPFHEPNQLFRNQGDSRYEEITERGGAVFELSEVTRGAAFGDVENDGDVDVLILNNNGPARLLLNRGAEGAHWIGLRLVGGTAQRDMLGALVAVHRPQGPPLWRRVRTDGSFASANDPRILIGLGSTSRITKVRVYWPSGRVEEWNDLEVDRFITLPEGGNRSPN